MKIIALILILMILIIMERYARITKTAWDRGKMRMWEKRKAQKKNCMFNNLPSTEKNY